MSNLQGSAISFPFRADTRGSLKTSAEKSELIVQEIIDVLETRRGERVMMPDYGLPDFVFAVANVGFKLRLRYEIETQIKRYVPLVSSVKVTVELDGNGQVIAKLKYVERDAIDSPKNLVFPVWQFVGG